MFIISLTSIPPRFGKIGTTLQCLLKQRAPADRILLHIPYEYRRFPDWDGTLPDVPAGVEIIRVKTDFGPATKVLPAVQTHRGQDVDILFCDDDRIYPPDWTTHFLTARKMKPKDAIAIVAREAAELFPSQQIRDHQPRAVQRPWQTDIMFLLRYARFKIKDRLYGAQEKPSRKVVKRAGYTDLIMGLGGVMVRPEHFDDIAFDIPETVWMVDDVWLSGMLAKNGVGLWTPANILQPNLAPAHFNDSLVAAKIGGLSRSDADRRCFDLLRERFAIWP